MNKSIIAILIILIITVPLLGFNLADPTMKNETGFEDNMVGVYITTEYIDLFDYESYMKDNFNGSNNMRIGENDSIKYNDRMYGTYDKETRSISFQEVEGILYSCILVEEESNEIHTSIGSNEISDGHTSLSLTDEGEETKLEGTIYVSPKSNLYLFINPIYQDRDGNIYLTSGQCMSTNYGSDVEGTVMSQTLTSETTIKEDKKLIKQSSEIKINIKALLQVRKVNVSEYDINGKNIKTSSYLIEDMPKEFSTLDETEYIIIESVKDSKITRELIQEKDTLITTYLLGPKGIFTQQSTKVIW